MRPHFPQRQQRVPSRFGFTGEQYTSATGLLHLRARDLDPISGRFLSADPVQPCPEGSHPGSQGYNLYAYVANNPTTLRQAQGKPGPTPAASRLKTRR